MEECGLTWLHVFPYSPRPGTPAARMPQLPKSVVRERAARLRAAAEASLARHLAAQVGQTANVLCESPRMGRTEGFTEVRFDADQPVGGIVAARITGCDGTALTAVPASA